MARQKILGLVLSGILLITAGCSLGGSTSTGDKPPPSIKIDKPSAIFCLGKLALHFVSFKDKVTELLVDVAVDALANAFAQSCDQLTANALTRIEQQLDPNTYLYVSPGQRQSQLQFSSPIALANCTSKPVSSDFTMNYPFIMDLASPTTQSEAIYNDEFSLGLWGSDVQKQVARYLVSHDHLQLGFLPTKITSPTYAVQEHPLLAPDEYMTMAPLLTITSMSGTYGVWQHGQLIQKAARWSYIKDVTFPDSLTVSFSSGAQAAGYCGSQGGQPATPTPTAQPTAVPTATPVPPAPTPTSTTAPLTSYTTNTPGQGCDPSARVQWSSALSQAHCGPPTTITKQVTNYPGNEYGWGEQRFQIIGQSLPGSYIAQVTISAISDPSTSGCAGMSVHNRSDGSSADTVQICASGTAAIISTQNFHEVSRVQWQEPQSATYVLKATVTSTEITLAVNAGQGHSAQVFVSTTSYVGLDVFWQHAGASANFTGFQYSAA